MLLKKEDYELTKRYYSIGEVAAMFGVSKSLIRYWEGEFDFLRPHKNSKGDRRFTPQNIDQVRLIFELVRERGFTLEGAKQEIERLRLRDKEKQVILNRLTMVRKGLAALQERLDEIEGENDLP